MRKLWFVLIVCFWAVCGEARAVVRPFLKLDCLPELGIFEIRVLRFEQGVRETDLTFLDMAGRNGSKEYELLKDKYGIMAEYQVVRDNPRQPDDNEMIKECVIDKEKYVIKSNDFGTTVLRNDTVLAKEIFFESAWNEWFILGLIYNAGREEFIVNGGFAFGLPPLYFLFSTKGGAVLDKEAIEEKGRAFLEELAVKDGLIRYDRALFPIAIDKDRED